LFLYVRSLAENNTVFENIQLPLRPPQLESLGLEAGDASALSEDDSISKGGVVGIVLAALFLGLTATGLYIWRQKGSNQLGDDVANLPVGELIDMPNLAPTTSSSTADASTLQPIAVDVLDTEHHLPKTKDHAQVAGEIFKEDASLEFKDQVRSHIRQAQSSPRSSSHVPLEFRDQLRSQILRPPRSSSLERNLTNEATRSVIGKRVPLAHAVIGPVFKDQADYVQVDV